MSKKSEYSESLIDSAAHPPLILDQLDPDELEDFEDFCRELEEPLDKAALDLLDTQWAELEKSGTSEGARRAWETRGKGKSTADKVREQYRSFAIRYQGKVFENQKGDADHFAIQHRVTPGKEFERARWGDETGPGIVTHGFVTHDGEFHNAEDARSKLGFNGAEITGALVRKLAEWCELLKYGTSEGARRGWDTRGRGKKTPTPATERFDEDSQAPKVLNGVPMRPWTPPQTTAGWAQVSGQKDVHEPPLPDTRKRLSAGCIVKEPDGRVWLVAPTDQYGDYEQTFPKGGIEPGMSAQATAIKETYEESGLKVNITGYAGDYEGDTSITRYYTAERVGGTPTDHGEESEAVVLADPKDLGTLLNRSRDRRIALDHVIGKILNFRFDKILKYGLSKDFDESLHPRDEQGKFTEGGGGGEAKVDASKWKQIGGQKGTNEGGLYEDEKGLKYYVKFYSNPKQIDTEIAAQKMYQVMNIHAPSGQKVDFNGKPALANKWEPVESMSKAQLVNWAKQDPVGAGKLYAISVAAQNWDVVGLEYDNLVKWPDGNVGVIDTGGSYLFRAQGGPKAYTADPKELSTFLSPKNPASSAVFGAAKATDATHFNAMAKTTFASIINDVNLGHIPMPPGVKPEEVTAKCQLAAKALAGELAVSGATPVVSAAVKTETGTKLDSTMAGKLAESEALNWETYKMQGPSIKSAMHVKWAEGEPNPAKPGSHGFQMYEIMKNGGTIADVYKYATEHKLGAQAYLKKVAEKGIVSFYPKPGMKLATPLNPLGGKIDLPKYDNDEARASFVKNAWAGSPHAAYWDQKFQAKGLPAEKIKSAVTPTELKAAQDYTNGGYGQLNNKLGHDHPQSMDDYAKSLLSFCKYWPVKYTKALTRADGLYPDIQELVTHGKVGDTFQNKTFWSTSAGNRQGMVTWHLTPKKINPAGAHIQKISHYHGEREILYPPRTKWKINGMEKNYSGHWTITAEEL